MALIEVRGIIVSEDPKVVNGNGGEFVVFRLSEGRKKRDGEYENAYYDVACYDGAAEFAKTLKRKDRVQITGAILYFDTKQTRDGQEVEYKKISINDRFGKLTKWDRPGGDAPSPAPTSDPTRGGAAFPGEASGMDDVPF